MAKKISGWDAEAAEKSTQPFGPLPPGDYIVEIVDATDEKKKDGANKGKIERTHEIKVVESFNGENIGRSVKFVNVQLTPTFASGKTNFQFYQLHKALGAEPGEFPDYDEVIGAEVGVHLGYRNRRSAKGYVNNQVRSFFEVGSQELKERYEDEPPANDAPAGASAQVEDDEFQIP